MTLDHDLLKIVSSDAKEFIVDLDVVTPTIYSAIFNKFASSHDMVIEDEDDISDRLLDTKISLLLNMQDKASSNVNKLSSNTNKAINAIKKKDDGILLEVLKETEHLKMELEQLKKLIYRDELTKTYNRKWLHDNVLDDDGQSFMDSGILAIVDLNYFKLINDTYGHVVGDKVLIFIANELRSLQGKVLRYGGDEFIVIFNEQFSQGTVVERLKDMREEILKKHMKIKGYSFKVSFAYGVKKFLENDSVSHIINSADKNMYADKVKMKERIKSID